MAHWSDIIKNVNYQKEEDKRVTKGAVELLKHLPHKFTKKQAMIIWKCSRRTASDRIKRMIDQNLIVVIDPDHEIWEKVTSVVESEKS